MIRFSGTRGDIRSAFDTAIHRCRMGAEVHLANDSNPLPRMEPSSPPAKRTLHLLTDPDIPCANDKVLRWPLPLDLTRSTLSHLGSVEHPHCSQL
jgi:hypothetical protein